MVAGIDISKDKFDGQIQDGKRIEFSSEPSEFPKVKKALAGVTRVLMEATGTYHLALAEYLHAEGFEVVVVNPAQAHYFAKATLRRNKTDKVDAAVLCEMAKDESHRLWSPPSKERKELVGLLRAREDLCVRLGAKAAQLKNPGITARERELYLRESAFLQEEKKLLEKDISELLKSSEELAGQAELLTSVPGIGPLTAATLLAHLPEDLASARQAAAYVGLTPKLVQSGLFKGRTRLSKMGHRGLRRLLYIASWSACKAPGTLKEHYERLTQRTGSKKAALLAVAHKILRIAFGVLKHNKPYDPKYLTTI